MGIKGMLASSDVIVSSELKQLVLEQVDRRAPRKNPVVWSEVLELGPRAKSIRTFVEMTDASSRSEIATCSSTDARSARNPRKRSRDIMS